MTKVSQQPIEPKLMGWYITQFWASILLLDNSREVKEFLRGILSHTETKMFAKRLQIARMLIQGFTYDEIIQAVKTTPTTIAKVSNLLESRGEGIKSVIAEIIKLENKKQRSKTPNFLKPKYSAGAVLIKEGIKLAASQTNKTIKRRQKHKSAQQLL